MFQEIELTVVFENLSKGACKIIEVLGLCCTQDSQCHLYHYGLNNIAVDVLILLLLFVRCRDSSWLRQLAPCPVR